jgi:UDP-N-acetyl-2-amino-2-deoxyglucuronate dehydrogenase
MTRPTRIVRAAIIGCGVIGPTHATALSFDRRVELVLACDSDLQAASRLGAPRVSANWRDALDPEIDLVCICTPHQLHADQCVAALAAGKHVICEKPLATSPIDINRMVDASLIAERGGQMVSGIFQHRFGPLARRLHELLRAGEFGPVEEGRLDFRCTRTVEYYASAPWRGRWDGEGGALMINQAIHSLDLLNWFCGKPVSVAGRVERRRIASIEAEDWAEATIAYAPVEGGDGATARVHCENDQQADWENRMSVRCRNGSFSLGSKNQLMEIEHPNAALCAELRALSQLRINIQLPGKACYGDHHSLQIQDCLAAITTGRRPFVRLQDAAVSNQVVLGLYQSTALGGATVVLPAENFRRPTLPLAAMAATAGGASLTKDESTSKGNT